MGVSGVEYFEGFEVLKCCHKVGFEKVGLRLFESARK